MVAPEPRHAPFHFRNRPFVSFAFVAPLRFQLWNPTSKGIPLYVFPGIRNWQTVTNPPALSRGGLHLWKIRTGRNGAPLEQLWPLLSPQECERASKLYFIHHRERFVRAHAGLRKILSNYINIEAQAIVLKYGPAGKPYLDHTFSSLDFNLTTSSDLALAALSIEEPIGIDCEQLRDRQNMVAIAKRMFTPDEAFQITTATTPQKRLEQFHVAWTALEAKVKADGRGLFHRGNRAIRSTIQIEHCVPEPGFIAAVARRTLPPLERWVTLELSGC